MTQSQQKPIYQQKLHIKQYMCILQFVYVGQADKHTAQVLKFSAEITSTLLKRKADFVWQSVLHVLHILA